MESLCIFSAGFVAFFEEAFIKWPTLGVATILQQCLSWIANGQLPTHHLFLGHCFHCPVDGPQAFCCMHFCTELKIVRKSCPVPVSKTILAADENSSSEVMHSCINCNRPPLPPCFPTRAASPTAGATDLFCRLGRVLVVVTPFSPPPAASSRPHCSSSLRSGGGSFRCRARRVKPADHVKSPRVSRNCCLLRPFAKAAARPTSVQLPPAGGVGPRSCTSNSYNVPQIRLKDLLLYVTI